MTDHKKIPVPVLMAGRPRDHRGYVIPYFQFIPLTFPKDGKVDFRIKDPINLERAVRGRLCGICGQPLHRTMYFIGGPDEMNSGLVTDPAMHGPCARYALQVCPLLASASYRPKGTAIEGAIDDLTRATERPDAIFMIAVTDYKIERVPLGKRQVAFYCRPFQPPLRIEAYQNGKQVDLEGLVTRHAGHGQDAAQGGHGGGEGDPDPR